MVKALILLLAASAAHAASLTARLDNTAVALGEPVSLTVQARGLNLDALDLAPLGAIVRRVCAHAERRSGQRNPRADALPARSRRLADPCAASRSERIRLCCP